MVRWLPPSSAPSRPRLKAAGLIYTKDIEQFYDPVKEMFLADRFIKGTCPKCGAEDQYGDNCEKCGAVYSPTELINPFSALSGAKPELRTSTHYFFRLSDPACVAFLRDWVHGQGKSGVDRVQPEIRAKDEEWLADGTSATACTSRVYITRQPLKTCWRQFRASPARCRASATSAP